LYNSFYYTCSGHLIIYRLLSLLRIDSLSIMYLLLIKLIFGDYHCA